MYGKFYLSNTDLWKILNYFQNINPLEFEVLEYLHKLADNNKDFVGNFTDLAKALNKDTANIRKACMKLEEKLCIVVWRNQKTDRVDAIMYNGGLMDYIINR